MCLKYIHTIFDIHLFILPTHQLAFTLHNLSTAYLDLGQPSQSIILLNNVLGINMRVHGPDHTTNAVILSNLSVAHRHLGNIHTSHELASQTLQKMEENWGASPGRTVMFAYLQELTLASMTTPIYCGFESCMNMFIRGKTHTFALAYHLKIQSAQLSCLGSSVGRASP